MEPVQLGTVTKTVTATGANDANYSVTLDPQSETFTVTGAPTGVGTLNFSLNTAAAPMDITVAIAADDTNVTISDKIQTAIGAEHDKLAALLITPFDRPTSKSTYRYQHVHAGQRGKLGAVPCKR